MRKKSHSNLTCVTFKCKKVVHNMSQHIVSVHERNKALKFDTYDYKCLQKGNLKQHVLSVHEGKKPYAY